MGSIVIKTEICKQKVPINLLKIISNEFSENVVLNVSFKFGNNKKDHFIVIDFFGVDFFVLIFLVDVFIFVNAISVLL